MGLTLDGNPKDVVNRTAVILTSSLIVVVAAAYFYDRRRDINEIKRRRPATWVLALLFCSYILLIPALFVTLFNMTIGAANFLELEHVSDSTVEFIHTLGETGSWVGAVMVAIFAIVVPLVKLVLLALGEFWRCSSDRRKVMAARMCIRFVQIISKWACPDVIAYIFLFYLVLHLNQPPVNGLFSLDVGFTCYTLFCWGSTISSLGVHLPALDQQENSEPKEPWAMRVFGRNGSVLLMLFFEVAFVVCFVLGMTWSVLGIRLEPAILENSKTFPKQWIDAMLQLDVVQHAKADVTVPQCIDMLVKTQGESFDANAILSIIMLVVFVLGLTVLDMVVLAVTSVQLLSCPKKASEDNSCNLMTLAKHLKKLAMLDVLILGIVVVVLSGSVYQNQGLVLTPGWGLLLLGGAEAMHYAAYALVRSFAHAKKVSVVDEESESGRAPAKPETSEISTTISSDQDSEKSIDDTIPI